MLEHPLRNNAAITVIKSLILNLTIFSMQKLYKTLFTNLHFLQDFAIHLLMRCSKVCALEHLKLEDMSHRFLRVFEGDFVETLEHPQIITHKPSSQPIRNLPCSSSSHKWVENQVTFICCLKDGKSDDVLWKWCWMFQCSI